jgi:hypothetical protein
MLKAKASANQFIQFFPPAFINPFDQNLKADLLLIESLAQFCQKTCLPALEK